MALKLRLGKDENSNLFALHQTISEKSKVYSYLCLYLCNEQRHVVTAKLVRAVTSSCLIQRLKSHGYRNPDHSRALSK